MRLRYFYDRRTSPAAAKGTGGEEEGSALFLSKAKAGLDTCLLHPNASERGRDFPCFVRFPFRRSLLTELNINHLQGQDKLGRLNFSPRLHLRMGIARIQSQQLRFAQQGDPQFLSLFELGARV
jgi:hypothetical protein